MKTPKKLIKRLSAVLMAGIMFAGAAAVRAEGVPSVSASSALLLDAGSGRVIFEKDADTERPMASTTKIMTALIAVERCDLKETVTVPEKAVGVEGSSVYLYRDEKLTVEELVLAMMLESANDAATAIAIGIAGSVGDFAVLMNRRAEELGLSRTSFENPHGLDAENHYTTARDLAVLTAFAMKNETFRRIVSTLPFGDTYEGRRRLASSCQSQPPSEILRRRDWRKDGVHEEKRQMSCHSRGAGRGDAYCGHSERSGRLA